MSSEIKTNKGAIVKEINGVKYFKLVSKYPGDYTKNCSLLGSEMDENFFFLRSYDIESAEFNDNNELVLTRVDGDTIVATLPDLPEILFKKMTFEFDKDRGVLIVTYPDGTQEELDGFFVAGEEIKVATDYTIKGDGRVSNPLRLNDIEKTGTYSPAKYFLDRTDGKTPMPEGTEHGKGFRIVTKENYQPFGVLYTYEAVKKIQSELEKSGSLWRVPSRKDWADLLDAAEYCEEDRTHDTTDVNIWTGKFAGSRAKSVSSWKPVKQETISGETEIVLSEDNLPTTGSSNTFHIVPIGYGEGSRGVIAEDWDDDIEGLYKLASFWSYTPDEVSNNSNPNIFTRTFSFDSRQVLQESSKPTSRLSLRLVKDYEYECTEFNEYDDILGDVVPTVLISNPEVGYSKIWTSVNIGLLNEEFSGVTSSEWRSLSGEDREIKEVFFVNEWDGNVWLKKQMRPGDSVVILDYDGDTSTSGDTYHEWRVYEKEDGTFELIDTSEALKKEVQEELDKMNEKIDEISGATEELNDKIDAETERALSAETMLAESIDSIEVKEVEPTSETILTSYELFINGETRGATINIPKDKSIKEITYGYDDEGNVSINEEDGEWIIEPSTSGKSEFIFIIYQTNTGKFKLVKLPLEDFIQEKEFKDGLEVKNHNVYVKIDPNSDNCISVGPDGILVSGLTSDIEQLKEDVKELSASTQSEIERSNRIDNNIAKDIIGAEGNSEDGYNIDFYEAIWKEVSKEEAESNPHTVIRIPEDYPDIPSASSWTGETYIEVFNSQTSTHSFYKKVSTTNYISEDKTIIDAIKTLDKSLKEEEEERKIEDEKLKIKIDETNELVSELSASTQSEIERLDGKDIKDEDYVLTVQDGLILMRENGEEIKINIDTNFGLLPNYE